MARKILVLVTATLLQAISAGAADLVSKAEPICSSAGGYSPGRSLSADGRFLAFFSTAANLVAGQKTRGFSNVYLRDRIAGTTVLVSHKTGAPLIGGDWTSSAPAVSADGNFLVFRSGAKDLIPGQVDSTGTDDLFLWDRSTGDTTLITQVAGSPGTGAGGSVFSKVRLSEDGRYVALQDSATNLVPGQVDTNSGLDVFLYDRVAGSTTLVSHTSASPVTTGSGQSQVEGLSADGRYLVFRSTATNLVPGGQAGIFLYDRVSGAVTHLAAARDSQTTEASISADGSFIALGSPDNLAPGQTDPQSVSDVYLYDRAAGTFTLLSHASSAATTSANGGSYSPILSAGGQYVFYVSDAANLVPGQTAGQGGQLFLYDRVAGTNVLVSHSSASPTTPSNDDFIHDYVPSSDGRYVAFVSDSTDLIPGQIAGRYPGNVFLYDRTTGSLTMPSHAYTSQQESAGEVATGPSIGISLSADGRWVAFGSSSSTLDPGDCNGREDVFLHDRDAGTNQIASLHDPGMPSLVGSARSLVSPGAASDDGRFAVFKSLAVNLAAGATDRNERFDVFLHDLDAGTNALVSASASSPGMAANEESTEPAISGDGRWVAFLSQASDLVPGQTDAGWYNAFLYDRMTGSRTLVDHIASSPTVAAAGGGIELGGLSANGRYVAFSSTANDLVPGQIESSSSSDVFVFDRLTGASSLVSRVSGSAVEAAGGWEPRISSDGRYVVFLSNAQDLVPGPIEYPDTFSSHVYLQDRWAGTTVLVSRASGPTPRAGNDGSSKPALSADGRFVAFLSRATDLVAGQSDANGGDDVFLYDRVLGTLTLASRASGAPATAGNGVSSAFSLSAEGTYVALESRATNLAAGLVDTNAERDVFLYDRRNGGITLVSHVEAMPTTAGNYLSTKPAVSADGTVAFLSVAQDLVSGGDDVQPSRNVFLYVPGTGANRLLSTAGATEPDLGLPNAVTVEISRNGRTAWFDTAEGDLVPGDYNGTEDVFADFTPPPPTDFHTLAPCRLLDTRTPEDGPALASGTVELLAVHGACGIPPAARALAVNVTVLGATGAGHLTLLPGGLGAPDSSTVNFVANTARSNNAIAALTPGVERGLAVSPVVAGGGTVHLILDVSGWFE